MALQGWIDEVDDGMVYGRVVTDSGDEMEFWTPLLLVMESQRVDLQPGSYCSTINGELLIHSTILATHDVEMADVEARRLYHDLGWDKTPPSSP